MNFFEHQDQARRKTGRLIVLFFIAVVLILAAVNAVAYGIMRVISPYMSYTRDAAPVLRGDLEYPDTFKDVEPIWTYPVAYVGVSIATLLIIAGGSLYKTAALSRGGHAVATLLGGRPLDPQSAQGQERVLQNVVEEMSIASGVPVPTVYVLENEHTINAFAAGFTTQDAVIGVTRGCVDTLNRDELQGVIAHEFSHILNGDMRLNIRLIGILHGILVIGLFGYALMRSLHFVRVGGRRGKNGGGAQLIIAIMLAGAALLIIGYVGVFFGRLIQAAVSRQREFLADASAVQFTRNPRGIAGALFKIGHLSGSQVNNYHAVETAHLFFANGVKVGLTSLLATHPPLEERIRRIDPHFQGKTYPVHPPEVGVEVPRSAARGSPAVSAFAATLPNTGSAQAHALAQARVSLDAAGIVDRAGAPSADSVEYAHSLMEEIPELVIRAAHEPFNARAIVLCLLLSDDAGIRQRQIRSIASLDVGLHDAVVQLEGNVSSLGAGSRLPLLDLSLPALRQMSGRQLEVFQHLARTLAQTDSRITLFEYGLLKVLDQSLRTPDARAQRGGAKFYALNAVKDEAAVLLSALAAASDADTATAVAAGARRLDPEDPPALAPDSSLRAVDAALQILQYASPAVKQRIIDACAHTVASDGRVTISEAELLRAIAATIDVPLPPLLARAAGVVSTADHVPVS